MKTARCVKEYANICTGVYKSLIKRYGNNSEYPDFPTDYLKDRIDIINRFVRAYENGMITIDDAMEHIAETDRNVKEIFGYREVLEA